MKKVIVAAILSLCCLSAFAKEAPTSPPASEASIKELLGVMNAHSLLDNMMGQLDAVMKNADQQALQGKQPTPEQQKLIDEMREKIVTMFKQEMSWDSLLPMYVRIYQQSFSQQEVDGMLKFYRSPAGQAMIRKMPLAMQNTMAEMQKKMGPMMQKMHQIMQESTQQIKDAANKAPDGNSATPAK